MPPQDQNDPLSPHSTSSGSPAVGVPPQPTLAADAPVPEPMARPSTQFRPENYSSSPEPVPSSPPTSFQPPNSALSANPPSPGLDQATATAPTTPAMDPGGVPAGPVVTPPDASQSSSTMPGLGSTTAGPDVDQHKRNLVIIGILGMVVVLVLLLAVILMMGGNS